jgi:hypothetical protein
MHVNEGATMVLRTFTKSMNELRLSMRSDLLARLETQLAHTESPEGRERLRAIRDELPPLQLQDADRLVIVEHPAA